MQCITVMYLGHKCDSFPLNRQFKDMNGWPRLKLWLTKWENGRPSGMSSRSTVHPWAGYEFATFSSKLYF